MDKKEITELAEQSYRRGYYEGSCDVTEEIKRTLNTMIASYQEAAKENLEQINKYWDGKVNEETDEKRTDK